MIKTNQRLVTVLAFGLLIGGPGAAHAQSLARIWAVDDGERIRQDDVDYPLADSSDNEVWDGHTIRIFGARNEIVAFQLILENGTAALDNVNVSLDRLTNGDSVIENTGAVGDPFDYRGKHIELFTEHYSSVISNTAGPTWWWNGARPLDIYDGEYVGLLPDALIPFEAPNGLGGAPFSIAPNVNQAIWIDIYIPTDAPTGTYSGELTVTVGGQTAQQIPIELQVYGFRLPDETHFKNFFVLPEGSRDGREGIRTKHPCSGGDAEYDLIEGRYYQMAHRHRMDINTNTDLDGMVAHFGRYITGEYYRPAHNYEGPGEGTGHGTYSIGTYDQPNHGSASGFWPNTETDWRNASDAWVTWFDQNAPNTVIFKYFPDEPMHDPDTLFPIILERADWIHNNPGPGGSLMVYCTVKLHPDLYGYVDFWSVTGQAGYNPGDDVLAGYDVPKVNERRAAGDRIGVYNSQRPGQGAVEAIDADAVEARVTPWIGFKYHIDQYFLWETSYWNNPNGKRNVFQTVYRSDGGSNGNGFFFYPGEEADFPQDDRGLKGPIASIRMKNWRRGQQDYEYLWLATQHGLADQVTPIVDSIVPRAFDDYGNGFDSQSSQPLWARRGYEYEAARRQIADLLASVIHEDGGTADAGVDDGATTVDGGTEGDAGNGADAGPAATKDNGGCNCRTSRGPTNPILWLVLITLIALLKRRRMGESKERSTPSSSS